VVHARVVYHAQIVLYHLSICFFSAN
jgi:hypothetical protein